MLRVNIEWVLTPCQAALLHALSHWVTTALRSIFHSYPHYRGGNWNFEQLSNHRINIWPSNSTPRYMPPKIENRDPNRYLYTSGPQPFWQQKLVSWETIFLQTAGWWGAGSGGNVSNGERWGAAHEALLTRPPLSSCCEAQFLTGGWEPLLYTHVHSSIIHSSQRWKHPKCPWRMDKQMWYIHIIEYYSVTKKNEILIYATKYMNLEHIMLSEISQSQKTKCYMIPLMWNRHNS